MSHDRIGVSVPLLFFNKLDPIINVIDVQLRIALL